jgi:uncharacterized protein
MSPRAPRRGQGRGPAAAAVALLIVAGASVTGCATIGPTPPPAAAPLAVPSLGPEADAMTAGRVTITTATGRTVEFAVRVADEPEERRQGLQGVAALPEGAGMLFDFGGQERWGGFWMRGTLVALDIAFVDADGVIVAVATMTPCAADPCPITEADRPYRAALEVGAGVLEASGVGPGDRLVWTLDPAR